MRARAENVALLRKRALRHGLLALQLLNAILQLDDLGFIHFGRCLDGRSGRNRARRRGRLLSSGKPHDDDHENGETGEKPGLHVLGEQPRRFRRFVLNRRWRRHDFLPHFVAT